ncbi:MAG: helicase-related protein [Parabacteroides sp.]|nr:helicase-related protein [Parabacteroides sp.]
MANNREVLANNIVDRFVKAISGTDKEQWLFNNPEDRIFIGKLSPQTKEETDYSSSSIIIKQISIEFRIPKKDIDNAVLRIYPQGNFFFRVLPSLEQQREFFLKNLQSTFNLETPFPDFSALAEAYNVGGLQSEMKTHKVPLLPIYEKIAIDRANAFVEIRIADIYDAKFDYGSVPVDSQFYTDIKKQVDELINEVKVRTNIMPCQFREKLTLMDLLTEEAWQLYIQKQRKREEFDMFPRFSYSLSVTINGRGEFLNVTVALSNETPWDDETSGFGQQNTKNDKYRISTLFNSGIKVKCLNTEFVPIELDYFADDYKYNRFVYALGNNCNVDYNKNEVEIQTTHVPYFFQHRLKTNDNMAIRFTDLISEPAKTLKSIHIQMQNELALWKKDFADRCHSLSAHGQRQFQNEIEAFDKEITRFATGIDLLSKYNMVCDAFRCMNQAFMNAAKSKGYDSWRLFQIVFIVSLLLDVVAHEPELMLDDDVKLKAKTDDLDILYFPTGGGKTEAFLGILVFNLFFDRLRGKNYGVTAFLKYPLRLLSVQQVQRVANILPSAEMVRQSKEVGGRSFSLGYFVGDGNTPNKISAELKARLMEITQSELDKTYRLLDFCPYCGHETVHINYDESTHTLKHICVSEGCTSSGVIPLYMVDNDIYRYLPSVIISTVDKMTAIGNNSRFRGLLCGSTYECPMHGFTGKATCIVDGVKCTADPLDFRTISMKDPAPTLMIQDELHLIKESLGTYDAHYETLMEYFIKNLSGCNRGIKVIGATATISAYAEQAKHLFWKDAIRFPAASPYLDHNFYSFIDKNDLGRIIVGYAPFGKAIVNSVAYSLQYLKRVVWNLYANPQEVLDFDGIELEGTEEERIVEVKRLLEEYWIILEYNNVKLESNRVLQALEDPINTELNEEGVQPLVATKMTGDDTFQEVRATLSTIEHAKSVINGIDFNMIAATSMISHGVDADRFNLMLFYGIPGNTAEYIQAYSRVGRKHTGVVIDIMRPSREKDQSYLKNFVKFHEYKDILVDPVSINRWATKAVDSTLPGVISAFILNHYLYIFKNEPGIGDVSKYSNLKFAVNNGKITADELKKHAYWVYKCSDDDSSVGKLYRQTIDRRIDLLFEDLQNGAFDGKAYITDVFKHCNFRVMQSLRDTDNQLLVEMK